MSVEFLITSMVVILLPGTGVIYTLAIGLGRGYQASFAAALGCTLGIVPAALASIIGLAAIFHTSALAFQLVKYVGVAYLLYMAWSILRDGGLLEVEENRRQQSYLQIAVRGALINVLNPKLSLFFLAFLPQFIDSASANATSAMVLLAAIFMFLTFAVFAAYGACASFAHDYVITRPSIMKWLKRTFAGVFGFLGFRLAMADH